jgi:hypothetical protein
MRAAQSGTIFAPMFPFCSEENIAEPGVVIDTLSAIHSTAALVLSHHEKQNFLEVVYKNFYKPG